MRKRIEIEVDQAVFDSAVDAAEVALVVAKSPYQIVFYAANAEEENKKSMHLENIRNIPEFFDIVKKCKGRVELVTEDGDRLNLKSKLCQYLALAEVFANGDVKGIELLCSDPEDIQRFFNYMMLGE